MSEDELQQQHVLNLLENIVDRQFLDAKNPAQEEMWEKALALTEQYKADIELAKGNAQRTKKLKDTTDSLAKALPGVTKGIHGAIKAFQQNDAIGGSAAIMDVFASMAPLLGTLAGSLGPLGTAFGMVLAFVSQVLGFFGPKPESLKETIKNALDQFQAEEKEYRIAGFRDNVTVYVGGLNKGIYLYHAALRKLEEGAKDQVRALVSATLLSLPGEVTPQVQAAWNQVLSLGPSEDDLAGVINTVYELVISFNPVNMGAFWETASFLKKPEKQSHKLWPVVLKLWCEAYTDLLTSTIQLASLLDESNKQTWIALAPPSQKQRVEETLSNLWSLGKARLLQYGSANELQVKNLKELRPAVQNRGMLFHIGIVYMPFKGWYSHPVYAGNNIRQGSTARLSDNMTRMSAAQGSGAEQPTYNLVAITDDWRSVYSSFPLPYENAKWESLPSFARPTDIWAVRGGLPHIPRNKDHDSEFCYYEAEGSNMAGWVRDKNGKIERFYIEDVHQPIQTIRAVHRPETLLDDPERTPESTNNPGIKLPDTLEGTACILYGQHPANSFIRVVQVYQAADGKNPGMDAGWVQGPWGTNTGFGIGVDRHYLWAFAPLGFACTTHASVLRALKRGPNQTPKWIHSRYVPEITSDPAVYPVTKGLFDLSPCDDGTLVASVFSGDRSERHGLNMPYQDYDLFSAAYRTDLVNGTIEVDKFTSLPMRGPWVHKLPLFCWPEFESLTKMVERVGPLLDIMPKHATLPKPPS